MGGPVSRYQVVVDIGGDDTSDEDARAWADYLAGECQYHLDNDGDMPAGVPFHVSVSLKEE